MICLGINIHLSTHNTPKKLFRRGIVLLFAGMALNIFRYIIPGILALILWQDPSLFDLALRSSLASDILYFAALCFFSFALLRRLRFPPVAVLCISVILSLTDALISNPDFGERQLLSCLVGNFIYIDRFSSFAFLQWFIFPACGYVFGYYLCTAEKKQLADTYRRNIAVYSLCLAAVLLLFCAVFHCNLLDISGNQFGTYNLSLLGAVIQVGIIFAVIHLLYLISRGKENTRIIRFAVKFSDSITGYYVIQWILVVWTTELLLILGCSEPEYQLSWGHLLLFYIGVVGVSTGAGFGLRKIIRKHRVPTKKPMYISESENAL